MMTMIHLPASAAVLVSFKNHLPVEKSFGLKFHDNPGRGQGRKLQQPGREVAFPIVGSFGLEV